MSEAVMKRVLYESASTGTPRLVLLTLAFRCNHEGWCYPSARWIAERAGLSSRSWVFKNLAKLEAAGEIVRVHRGNDERGNDSSVYLLPRYADPDALADYLAGSGPYSAEIRKACKRLGLGVGQTSTKTPPGVGSDTRVVSDQTPAPGVGSDTLKDVRLNDVTDNDVQHPPSPDGSGQGASEAKPSRQASVEVPAAGGGRPKAGKGSAAPRPRDEFFDAFMRLHGKDPDKPPARLRGLGGDFSKTARNAGLTPADMRQWYRSLKADGRLTMLRPYNSADWFLQWARETGRASAPDLQAAPAPVAIERPAGAPDDWQDLLLREDRGRLVPRQEAEAAHLLGLPPHSPLPDWWQAGRRAWRDRAASKSEATR